MFENKSSAGAERRSVGSLLEDFFNNGVSRVLNDDFWNDGKSAGVPVNIREMPTAYEMQVVAPGLQKEDFKIHLDKNLMTVSFDAVDTVKEGEEGRWLRQEYKHRSFRRTFTLNDRIDTSGIQARYADGLLYVNLPKKDAQEATPQQITVG